MIAPSSVLDGWLTTNDNQIRIGIESSGPTFREDEPVKNTLTLYRVVAVDLEDRSVYDFGMILAKSRDHVLMQIAREKPDLVIEDLEVVIEPARTFQLPDKE